MRRRIARSGGNVESDHYSESHVFNAGGRGGGKPLPLPRSVGMAQFAFTGQGTPQQALPQNLRRRYLIVQNVGAVDAYLGFGSGATEGQGLIIIPGGNYLADYACPTDAIFLYFAGGAAENAILCEGTQQG